MPYGQPDIADEEARKKKAAENPLAQYFGGNQAQAKPAQTPPAQTQPAPAPAVPAAPPTNTGAGAQRQQPTGFTNFSRVQAANRDVSRREAAAYGAKAESNASAAQRSLAALRARFGAQVDAGTVAGTTAAPHEGALMGPLDPMSGLPVQPTDNLTVEQMYEKAGQEYSGPGGLGDIEGVDDTYAQTLAADQNLNALGDDAGLQALIREGSGVGRGTSAFSSGLIGSAGRKDFDALRARFSPEGDIEKAETESAAQARAAGDLSAKNAGDWRAFGDATQADNDRKAKEAEDAAAKAKADGDAAAKEQDLDARFEEAMKHDADDLMNSNFESFNTVFNPITQVAGQLGARDPIQDYGTKLLSPASSAASGGGHRKIWWKPEHKEVFRQMDDEQWNELRNLPQSAQARWLDTRADEVKRGVAHAHFDATKDYGKNAFYGWKL